MNDGKTSGEQLINDFNAILGPFLMGPQGGKDLVSYVPCMWCKEHAAEWRYQEMKGEPEICDKCHSDVHNPLSWARVGKAEK